MNEWIDCTLGDMITLQRGHDLPRRKRQPGKVPVAGSNGVIGFHNISTTKAPGVTIGRSGNLGNANLYTEDFWAHNTTLYVKDFKGNNEIFVYYFLKNIDFRHFNAGSAVPTLNRNHIHPLTISIPCKDEQKAIAGILSSLDAKIELLQRQNKTLEALAETLYRQWFVEEAEEGWEVCSLYDAIDLVGGGTPKTKDPKYWDGNIYWLSGGDISSNHKKFVISSVKKITELGLNNSSTKLLPKYSTVISARGTVGKYCILGEPMAFSQTNYGIMPKYENCYFFTYLLIDHSVTELMSASYGSVFDTITTRTFQNHQINIPPVTNIIAFEEIITPYFTRMKLNQDQILTLENLRDTLLPKLMSGIVRVH